MTPHALIAPARLAGQPVLMTQTDERLVDLVRAGCEPAFEAIVTRYRKPLLRYCSRILTEERAEDAVQQTFVGAYGAMRKNGDELKLRPWLYRIAHNNALNALRDRGLRHEELSEQIDGVERPDQVVERAEGLQAVVSAVQDLPERQRDAIVLRELEGRSYDEIADELGVTGGAVRQLLNRARNTLRTTATALTPAGFVAGIPWEGGAAAAGGGAIVAKVCATALVTGAVVTGGAAVAPELHKHEPSTRPGNAVPSAPGEESTPLADPAVSPAPAAAGHPATRGAGGPGSGDRQGGSSKRESRSSGSGSSGSNSGSGSESGDSGSSGPGPGGSGSSGGSSGNGSGSSGSGSSGSDSGSHSIGSGSSGSGSSGSGSSDSGSGGRDSSGSGSSGSGSGSGSSGSGTSGSSGSGSSGSGSSGSGSSGSVPGSSGSGSGSGTSRSSGSGSGDGGSSGSGSSGSG